MVTSKESIDADWLWCLVAMEVTIESKVTINGNFYATGPDLLAIVLNDSIVMQYCPVTNYHYVHNLWQSVRGGGGGIFMVWLFSENGSISEQIVNRALIDHTTL